MFELGDDVFVQIARADDLRVCETCVIKHVPRFNAQRDSITGIQPHTDHFVSVLAQLSGDINRVTHAVDGVVGVHQENAVVRNCSRKCFKRIFLVLEKHDPAVRLRSAHWNAEACAGLQIRCAGTAANVSRTGRR